MSRIKIKKGRNTVTTDIAYIAGFFDGEGCIRLKKANKKGNCYYVWVAITNCNKETLNYIVDIFGGRVRKAEYGKNKIVYHFLITSSEAVDMLKVLYVFLREKKDQAKLAIQFHETKEELSPEFKEMYVEQIKKLKVVGNIYENPELPK